MEMAVVFIMDLELIRGRPTIARSGYSLLYSVSRPDSSPAIVLYQCSCNFISILVFFVLFLKRGHTHSLLYSVSGPDLHQLLLVTSVHVVLFLFSLTPLSGDPVTLGTRPIPMKE